MKIYISPMAGITDYSYRKILEKFNPDLMFAEMVNAHLMTLEDKTTINELLKCDNFEKTAAQVFGNDKNEIIYSFLKLENIGFKHLNLNMGCPQPKIIKNGAGSALLPNIDFIQNLLFELKSKLKSDTKLSIKIRIGYKDFKNPKIYVKMANDFNLDFICVHGRTQEQIYNGTADWEKIEELSKLPRNIDFIGNGDLFLATEIKKTISKSNLDGIMLARGIVGNPWLISQTKEILSTGKITTKPTFSIVKELLLEHLHLLIENKGEITASMEINKYIRPYFQTLQISENFEEIEKYKNDKLKQMISEIIITKNIEEKIRKIENI